MVAGVRRPVRRIDSSRPRSGCHEVVVDAWTDRFETWRRELRVRLTTGEDLEPELLEGASDHRRAGSRAPPADRGPPGRCRLDAAIHDVRAARAARRRPRRRGGPGPRGRGRSVGLHRERAASRCGSNGNGPRSVPGTSSSRGRRAGSPAVRSTDSTPSPRWGSTSSTFRRSIPSATPTARAAATRSPRRPTIRAARGRSGRRRAATRRWSRRSARSPTSTASWSGPTELGLEVALDYALQCSPDHPWVRDHPEWFHHLPDGSIRHAENPPKKYQDIVPIDFWPAAAARAQLWDACRDVARVLDRPRRADLPGRQPAHQARRLLGVVARRRCGPTIPTWSSSRRRSRGRR